MFLFAVHASASDGYETPGIIDGGIYNIKNTRSGKNLDINNNGKTDNTTVIQYTANSTQNNQKFRIDYRGNGLYTITAMNSLKLLTVKNAVNQNQAPVVIYSADAKLASDGGQYEGQYYKIRANSDGSFTFLTMASNYTKVLDVYSAVNNGQDNGAVLQQYADTGAANQKFTLSLCDTIGFETSTSTESTAIIYRLKNVYSGQYLDVNEGDPVSGTNVQTYPYHPDDSLKWTIRRNTSGKYRLYTEVGNYGSFVLNVDSSTDNCNISSSKTTQSIFHIIRINSGAYAGCYYIKFGNKFLTQVTTPNTDNSLVYNVKLTTTAGTNSIWSFEKASDLSAVIFTNQYDEDDGTYSTVNSGDAAEDALNSVSYHVESYLNLGSCSLAMEYMNYDPSIAIHCGHGWPGAIIFHKNEDTGEWLTENTILGLSLNEYSNIACFISIGCESGLPGDYGVRFPDAMYERGVSYALCFKEKTYNTDKVIIGKANISKWMNAFMQEAIDGKTIEACVDAGNDALTSLFTTPYTYYAVGDDKQVLIH